MSVFFWSELVKKSKFTYNKKRMYSQDNIANAKKQNFIGEYSKWLRM